jgi:tetratricopeptide (TPR) repeat protein
VLVEAAAASATQIEIDRAVAAGKPKRPWWSGHPATNERPNWPLLQAAISRQAAGDMAQADALYDRAVRLNRRNEEALHRWALVKQAIGQHNAALDLLNRGHPAQFDGGDRILPSRLCPTGHGSATRGSQELGASRSAQARVH